MSDEDRARDALSSRAMKAVGRSNGDGRGMRLALGGPGYHPFLAVLAGDGAARIFAFVAEFGPAVHICAEDEAGELEWYAVERVWPVLPRSEEKVTQ